MEDVLGVFSVSTIDDLVAGVGAGNFTGQEVVEAVYPGLKSKTAKKSRGWSNPLSRRRKKKAKKAESLPIKGLIPGMALHFAGCCNALPGDRIVGIVTKGRGVTVHTIDCETLEEFAKMTERWIDVSWDADAVHDMHVSRIQLVVANEPGSLGDLSTVIARNDGNISNLKITNRSSEFFDISVDIEVNDVKHLVNIIAALRAAQCIKSVERVRG